MAEHMETHHTPEMQDIQTFFQITPTNHQLPPPPFIVLTPWGPVCQSPGFFA